MGQEVGVHILQHLRGILVDQRVHGCLQVWVVFQQKKRPVREVVDIDGELENNALYAADHFRQDQREELV